MTNTVLHKANSRGHADHGWLNAYHSFSFASWYNPDRVQFGMLRVLNDDTVAAGMGFGTHPHDNMEIITIPLEGDLAHKDSMGNAATIKTGDVQVMSAGTGIQHSEFNPNHDQHTKLFQIWVFPKHRNVEPRYQQITLEKSLENIIEYLSTSNLPLIPVLDERNKLIGVIDFEVIRPIVFNPYRIKFTEVKEIMSLPKEIINHDDGMETIMEKFEATNETILPVTKNGKFFGLISKVDLLEAYRQKLKEMIIE